MGWHLELSSGVEQGVRNSPERLEQRNTTSVLAQDYFWEMSSWSFVFPTGGRLPIYLGGCPSLALPTAGTLRPAQNLACGGAGMAIAHGVIRSGRCPQSIALALSGLH